MLNAKSPSKMTLIANGAKRIWAVDFLMLVVVGAKLKIGQSVVGGVFIFVVYSLYSG